MTYLLDANVLIQAKNLHYGFDFCPAFWDWLIENNIAKRVFSVEKVGDEINAGDDELADWALNRGAGFFLKPDAAILPAVLRKYFRLCSGISSCANSWPSTRNVKCNLDGPPTPRGSLWSWRKDCLIGKRL